MIKTIWKTDLTHYKINMQQKRKPSSKLERIKFIQYKSNKVENSLISTFKYCDFLVHCYNNVNVIQNKKQI